MKIRLWHIAIGLILLAQACDPDPVIPLDRGEDYFPLRVGKSAEYQVDSIIFDDFGSSNKLDTFSSFVRERITEVVSADDGDTVYLLERAHRPNVDDPWSVTDIWTTGRNFKSASRVEENQRLILMEFPLYDGRRWDPTRFIDETVDVPVGTELIEKYAYWDGRVLDIHESLSIGDFTFDDVLICRQADEDTEIERRYVREWYAKGIGLVARTDTILDSRCKRLGDFGPCIGQTWMQKGEKGYIMRMELIAHN